MKRRKDPLLRRFAKDGLRFPQVPASDGYFIADDARLYFASFGNGRPIILLHGGMGNGTNWSNQIGALTANGHRVIVMDTRAHGRSTSGQKKLSYGLFANDVNRLMENLGLEKAILVGWSDGACTALELARTNPLKVAGVVFFACNVDPTGTAGFKMTETIENCVARHKIDFEAMTPTKERFEDLQPKLEPMQKNEPNYTSEDLAKIHVPVAVIQGENDEFIRLSHAKYISESLALSSFEVVKGVGHFAPIQSPKKFNRVVLRSIRRFGKTRHS